MLNDRYTLPSSPGAGSQTGSLVQSELLPMPCFSTESLLHLLGPSNAAPTPFSASAVSAFTLMKYMFYVDTDSNCLVAQSS